MKTYRIGDMNMPGPGDYAPPSDPYEGCPVLDKCDHCGTWWDGDEHDRCPTCDRIYCGCCEQLVEGELDDDGLCIECRNTCDTCGFRVDLGECRCPTGEHGTASHPDGFEAENK